MNAVEELNRLVSERLKAINDCIEKACEQSLQSGKHGVLVLTDRDGTPTHAGVHESVPYGYIYYRYPEDSPSRMT